MKRQPACPLIFEYSDVRDFLNAYAEYKRLTQPKWSLGMWARRLGLSAAAPLTMVLKGKRNIGRVMTKKLLAYFQFSKEEESRFLELIRLMKVSDPDLKELLASRIRRKTLPKQTLDEESLLQMSSWISYALRQMAHWPEFKNEFSWITKCFQFSVSAKEVHESLSALLKLGLISEKDGKIAASKTTLETIPDQANMMSRRLQLQMMGLAEKALETIPLQEREIMAMTFNMPRGRMKKAKELVRKFFEDFEQLIEDPQGDATYQINVQLFPLAVRKN